MGIRKILTLSAFVVGLQASATDVYVYMAGNYVPVASLGNIRKIINGSTGTTLISAKGDTVNVENAAFTYITFHSTSIPVGIEIEKSAGTYITSEGGAVRVSSSATPQNISLISYDGAVFASITPTESDVVVSTAGIPVGVYVVSVVTADGKKLTKKIIKK